MLVRPYDDADAAAVTPIWVAGLQQTIDAAPWLMRPLLSMLMGSLSTSATSATGDFGPNGVNIRGHWVGSDRAMLVAAREGSDEVRSPHSHRIYERVFTTPFHALLGRCWGAAR